MFKNITVLELGSCDYDKTALIASLAQKTFNHCGASVQLSKGFSPVVEGGELVVETDRGFLINFTVEKKMVPGAALKEAVAERIKEIESQTGAKVGRRESREIKEAVFNELLPRAFANKSDLLVWLCPKNNFVLVNSASSGAVESFLTEFFKVVDHSKVLIKQIETEVSDISSMKNWLASKEGLTGFNLDSDCLLKGADKSAVRFTNHNLESALEHIDNGYLPVELSMTWASRVSFVMTQGRVIKKIKLLDIGTMDDDREPCDDLLEKFKQDFFIESIEITNLLHDLIAAMGGKKATE